MTDPHGALRCRLERRVARDSASTSRWSSCTRLRRRSSGDQHAVPPRRGTQQRGGLCGERVLHGRTGSVRGADGCRRRHARSKDVLSPRHDYAGSRHGSSISGCGKSRRLLGVGPGFRSSRTRLHVLFRSGRGLARGRAVGERLRRQAGVGVRQGEIVQGIAMLGGSVAGGAIAQATNLGVPYVIRVIVLALTFLCALVWMRDVGFTPGRGESRSRR